MEFFRDPKIDFMKYRKVFLLLSSILILIGFVSIFVHGKLNVGIDFAGGTQLTLKFAEQPSIEDLRDIVNGAGIQEAMIQRFGEEGDNEVMIKTPTVEDSEEGSQRQIEAALHASFGQDLQAFDLNQTGTEGLADFLLGEDPDSLRAADEDVARAHYQAVAADIMAVRKEDGLFDSWDEVASAEGVSAEALETLRSKTLLGDFAVVGAENVGPQIGAELRQKGILAVVFSLVGMLLYIWYRFELRFGIGALVAVLHDVFVVLGLYALAGFEFNLTTIAAFLTLVGYSVNDTVVIFDRVRENMRRNPRAELVDTMNVSLNQTLSRTVLTSGTTILVVGCLLVYGGDVLRGFAFILTVGVVIGTYSSVYVASPFALAWEHFSRRGRSGGRPAKATG